MADTTDLETLGDTAIERAQELLSENGGFEPFALAIESDQPEADAEIALIEVSGEDGDPVPADESLPVLIETLGEGRDGFRAVVIAFESELDDGRDALAFLLQHESGAGLDLYLPYRTVGDEIHYSEPEQQEPTLAIWTD